MCRVLGSLIIYPRTLQLGTPTSFFMPEPLRKALSLIKTDGIQSMVSRDGSFSEYFDIVVHCADNRNVN